MYHTYDDMLVQTYFILKELIGRKTKRNNAFQDVLFDLSIARQTSHSKRSFISFPDVFYTHIYNASKYFFHNIFFIWL